VLYSRKRRIANRRAPAYALAAGNAVVFKPSELTPLVAVKLAEIARATFALPDLLQVVTGAGATGAALAKAAVDKIAFTGSAGTGKRVMIAAADRLTPVLLELGGKDPMIIAEDADLDKAAEACVYGALTNTGQACISVERVYVADAIHDRFVDKVIENVRALKIGGDDGDLGAMTSPAQVAIVKDHLADAVAKGAKVKTGGIDAISGSYIQPTVLTDVTHQMGGRRAPEAEVRQGRVRPVRGEPSPRARRDRGAPPPRLCRRW